MFHIAPHDARTSAVLTPEQSAAIFQKDLANIIAKTRDGKTLSATERRALCSVPVTGQPLPSVGMSTAALNEVTGEDRRTLKKVFDSHKRRMRGL